MRLTKKKIEELRNYIFNSKRITLITHNNPDGDAIGSSTGMYNYLKGLDKDVVLIIPNTPPTSLHFLLEDVCYINAERDFKKVKARFFETDLLIVLDMANSGRAGENIEKLLNESPINKILFDHHENPEKYDLVFSEPKASSTCEVVYRVLVKLENKKVFSISISQSLYSGLLTDTGSFSYSCDNTDVYSIASNLLKAGLVPSKLHQKIFDTYSYNRLSLLGYAISKKLRFFPKERAAFIWLSKEDLFKYHYEPGDLEGVVNYCLKLEEVDFCALLSERDGRVRMSFRSNDASIDVNKFANKYWNGGGHIMAAGGKSFENIDDVVKKLTQQIKNRDFISK